MTPELAYFLKINVGIALFYAFYWLFFFKDTFFYWRRTAFLCFLGISLLYPLLNFQEWVQAHEPMVAMADLYAMTILPEVTINPAGASGPSIDWLSGIRYTLFILYAGGVLLLSLRFLTQFISILHLRINCRTECIQGTCVYILTKQNGPFSFFQWIFLNPETHTDNEISEILTHERTHVGQWHSVDVLFSELICIACWFNPFAWLMKREIRNNLEYMADNQVIRTGHDYKTYQYHLLGLAHQKAAATLYNSFNVLPLKNRITMMNKKRTNEIGRTKYLMFLPLAALLMIISNIEAVARSTKNITKDVIEAIETGEIKNDGYALADTISPAAGKQKQTKPEYKGTVADKSEKKTDGAPQEPNDVFDVVEQMPEFPGGMQGMMAFLSRNIRYPVVAQEKGIRGRVIAQFIVEKDGSISKLSIAKSADPDLDAEALRVLSTMPKWTPGKQRGKNVRVRFTVPVSFNLEDPKNEEIKSAQLSEVVVVGYAPSDDPKDIGEVFDIVEEMPKFPGGISGLMNYLARNIKYPVIAQKSKTQGRVIVEMTVDKEGRIVNPKIVQGVSTTLDAEAIRVVSAMPRWEPGKQKGEIVAVKYTIPIMFKLQ